VVLSGGGVKSAVAAGRYAAEHELILVQVNFGQEFAEPALKAQHDLAASFPSARVVSLDLPHIDQMFEARRPTQSETSNLERTRLVAPTEEAVAISGLLTVLLSMGVQCAEQFGAVSVVTGLSRLCPAGHLGLHASGGGLGGLREFLHTFQIAIEAMPPGGSKIRVESPLLDMTYGQMIMLAQRFGVQLDRTWSCESAAPYPCKACDSCKSRAKAFADAAIVDPLLAHPPGELLRTHT
jgi:7-cyano-7-deazaguanine synthase in queuosine biosynthesis